MFHAGNEGGSVRDEDLAAELAGMVAEMLAALQRGPVSGPLLGRIGDRAAQCVIAETLGAERPGDAILSEEAPDDPARLAARRVWIVDPLDGTAGFSARGDEWAVHIALVEDGVPVLGAVARPGEVHRSDRPAPLGPLPPRLRLLVSRSRIPDGAEALAAILDADLAPMCSVGAKVAALLRGEAELYFHAGGQHEWDNCAPAAVALAAGLHASRIDGSPLRYNNADTWLPDCLICRAELADAALAAIARLPRP